MVRGLGTDDKQYKHIDRSDEKWLCEDLNVFRRTVEKYIDRIRPDDEKNIGTSEKRRNQNMTIIRILAILFLGIFGSMNLITGVYLLIKEIYVLGIPLTVFGTICIIAFCLFEIYRGQ